MIKTRTEIQKKNLKIKIITGALIVTLIILIATIFINLSGDTNKDSNASTNNDKIATEKVRRSVTGKTSEEDKKDAMNAAAAILKEAAKNPSGEKDLAKRLTAIEQGDKNAVSSDLEKMIRWDGFNDDMFLDVRKVNTLQALVALSANLEKEKVDFKPKNNKAWQSVFLDQGAGYAVVPLTVFRDGGIFEFNMVYTDDGWKLAPRQLLKDVEQFSKITNNEKQPNSGG